MPEPRTPTVMTSFRLPQHLKAAMQEIAAEEGVTFTEALVEAMEQWIGRRETARRR